MPQIHLHSFILLSLLCGSAVTSNESHIQSGNATVLPTTTKLIFTEPSLAPSTNTSTPDNTSLTEGLSPEDDISTNLYPDSTSKDDELMTTSIPASEGSTSTIRTPSTTPAIKKIIDYEGHDSGEKTSGSDESNSGDKTYDGSSSVGVIFIFLTLIIVIILGAVLYILWKKGRSYSFDLTSPVNDHDTPLRSMEHGGVFEQTSKEIEALDYIQEDKPPEDGHVANGCAGETDEQTASSEEKNVPEEDSYMSETSLTPPIKKVEFNLDLDLISGGSEPPSLATDEPTDPQQNENNNNVTHTGNDSMDLFTEINLDEPQ